MRALNVLVVTFYVVNKSKQAPSSHTPHIQKSIQTLSIYLPSTRTTMEEEFPSISTMTISKIIMVLE
jgi:hypothetical protein